MSRRWVVNEADLGVYSHLRQPQAPPPQNNSKGSCGTQVGCHSHEDEKMCPYVKNLVCKVVPPGYQVILKST
jgi:hypothetical protein